MTINNYSKKRQSLFKILNQERVQNIRVMLALTATIIFTSIFVSFNLVVSNTFRAMHWVFNYEYGFIKRGLVGEIVTRIFSYPTIEVIVYLSTAIAFLVAFILIFLFFRPTFRNIHSLGIWLFSIFAASHFATLQHYFYDMGRFDHFGIIILFLCILVIERLPDNMWSLAVILFFCVVGLLIHETFFFNFIPLVFSYWFFCWRGNYSFNIARGFAVISLIIVTLYIGVYGKMTNLSPQEYFEVLQSLHGRWINERPILLILFSGLKENVLYAVNTLLTKEVLYRHLIWFVALLPTIFLFSKIWKILTSSIMRHGRDWPMLLFIISAFSPLCMYLLGNDFGRWIALALTNSFIVLSLLMYSNVAFKNKIGKLFFEERKIVLLSISLSLLLGPLEKGIGFIWMYGYSPSVHSRHMFGQLLKMLLF